MCFGLLVLIEEILDSEIKEIQKSFNSNNDLGFERQN